MLARTDIDLRRAVKLRYDLAAVPTPDQVSVIAEPWRPARTRACFYLWQSR